MELVFLGTGSMVPTKDRNHSAVFVSYRNEGILVDCGEGTQRQLKIAGINQNKITKILITHWHGDHSFGLIPLMQSLGSTDYHGVLEIYGPEKTIDTIRALNRAFPSESRLRFVVKEIESGQFFENKDFCLEAAKLDHSVPCLGFAFIEKDRRKISKQALKKTGLPEGPLVGELQEGKTVTWQNKKIRPEDVSSIVKGKKIAFVSDTAMCRNAVLLAKDADLVVCEATFADDVGEKADSYKHLTAENAGMIANKANAKKLVLTHFSQRYKTSQQIEEDARNVFDNVVCAKDFMRVVI